MYDIIFSMSTLCKNENKKKPIKSLLNYQEIDFSDYKEYEMYRFVDPINKTVYRLEHNALSVIENERCYDLWGHN